MERQSGLGRSLEDVLDSLTPTDPDPAAPGRVLFEPEALEQQLDSLVDDIRELRDRVQHLVSLVPEADAQVIVRAAEPGTKKPKKKSAKKKAEKKRAKKHKQKHPHAKAA
jgi:hypothetical protein